MVVVLESDPLVPVMVTVKGPVAALLLVVRVKSDDVPEDVGLNDATTPLGNPLAVKVTLPAKPPVGTTLIVEDPLFP